MSELKQIETKFRAICRYCGRTITEGEKILWDPNGARGKRTICSNKDCQAAAFEASQKNEKNSPQGTGAQRKKKKVRPRPTWLPREDLLRQMKTLQNPTTPDLSSDIMTARTTSLAYVATHSDVLEWTQDWQGEGTGWLVKPDRADLLKALVSGKHPKHFQKGEAERLKALEEAEEPEDDDGPLVKLPLPRGAANYEGQIAGIALPGGWPLPERLPPAVRMVDEDPHWVEPNVPNAIRAIASGMTTLLWGPAGSGKTTLAEQVAARSKRPFCRVVMNRTAVFEEIVGEVDPSHPEGWRPGNLIDALTTPGCLILIDEIWALRPDWSQWVTQLLDSGVIQTSARRFEAADGVTFVLADNTCGHGSNSAATSRYHREAAEPSILSRVGWIEELRGLREDMLARVLTGRTGCPQKAAEATAKLICTLSEHAQEKDWSTELSVRDGVHFVQALMRGTPADQALEGTILGQTVEEDREAVRIVVETVAPLDKLHLALGG